MQLQLPDFLKEESEEAIMRRMLARIPADIDKSPGSFIWDALAPMAAELAQVKIEMGRMLNRAFIQSDDCYGPYVKMIAATRGLIPKSCTNATGILHVSGVPGTLIPEGTIAATTADLQRKIPSILFRTKEDGYIGEDGTIDIAIEALEAGVTGNVAAEKIVLLLSPISGVSAVTNISPTSGGTPDENDTELKARFFELVQKPITSGNVYHYLHWAKEVPGVGGAKVFPLWNGPGTVKVAVIDANKEPASTELVERVYYHIEQLRPIGASVTVSSAKAMSINITGTLVLENTTTLEVIKTAFTEACVCFFRTIAFQTNSVSIAKVGSLLLSIPGVIDYSDMKMNDSLGNVALGEDGVPVLGLVSFVT
ncbi:baseplate j family protein [Heliobacillus mobilis]|uniref:Baseplate j family protein n=1 Tax=Heliobacterium mobile TaxID=28064 RepID=A0A6I3SFD9_HELMO|nr:baseplate J/gp47 family protein [Heliobacterium mobile]MTV47770.1 baseplate j family protein [Heliobacterium mobile]